MKTLILSSYNQNKIKEFRYLLRSLVGWGLVDLLGIGKRLRLLEDGSSYQENAKIKAQEVAQATGHFALADDSGLEVDALFGAPGMYSARYAGQTASDEDNMNFLLKHLTDVKEEHRTARFRCVLCLAGPNGDPIFTFEGVCEGTILLHQQGKHGFGYDPLFIPTKEELLTVGFAHPNFLGKTFGELPSRVKNRISHRAKAIQKLIPALDQILSS